MLTQQHAFAEEMVDWVSETWLPLTSGEHQGSTCNHRPGHGGQRDHHCKACMSDRKSQSSPFHDSPELSNRELTDA